MWCRGRPPQEAVRDQLTVEETLIFSVVAAYSGAVLSLLSTTSVKVKILRTLQFVCTISTYLLLLTLQVALHIDVYFARSGHSRLGVGGHVIRYPGFYIHPPSYGTTINVRNTDPTLSKSCKSDNFFLLR